MVEFIERRKDKIKIDSIGRITLTEGFCLEAIELARKMFADVLAAVPDEFIP